MNFLTNEIKTTLEIKNNANEIVYLINIEPLYDVLFFILFLIMLWFFLRRYVGVRSF